MDEFIKLLSEKQWVPAIAALTLVAYRLFKDDMTFWPTLPNKYRALFVAVLGIANGTLASVVGGASFWPTLLTGLMTAGPGLVWLIVEIVTGKPGGPPAAGGKAAGLATLAFMLLLPGCSMSLEQAHKTALSNRAVAEIGGVPSAPDSAACASLDAQHRTWGAIATATGLLAGTGGVTTLPIPDGDKTARIALATTSLVLGVIAATAVYVEQQIDGTYTRECTADAPPVAK